MNKIMKLVSAAIKNSSLDDYTKNKLIPKSSMMPPIYGTTKIHKQGAPLRPIVNTIGSPTYNLSKYLVEKLKPLAGNTFSFVKESTHLVRMMKEWKIEEKDILTSFDVISLYTKIPIDEAIEVIRDIVNNDETMKLVEICLKSTFFSFSGEIYEKKEGVAMGSPLSPIVHHSNDLNVVK